MQLSSKLQLTAVAYPGMFFRGVQQIRLRTEGRENGDLGAGSPLVRGTALIRLLRMYVPLNREFGLAL
jgi:hypothetical protein